MAVAARNKVASPSVGFASVFRHSGLGDGGKQLMAKGSQGHMPTHTDAIRIIVFKEEGQWVAQCLEFDISAQADDLDTLNERLMVTLQAELKESVERHGKPFAGIEPAPKKFHMMWDRRPRSVEVSPAPWVKHTTRRWTSISLLPDNDGVSLWRTPNICSISCVGGRKGCKVQSGVDTAQSISLTKIIAPSGKWAIVAGILPSEMLVPTTIGFLDRRLGLISPWFGLPLIL